MNWRLLRFGCTARPPLRFLSFLQSVMMAILCYVRGQCVVQVEKEWRIVPMRWPSSFYREVHSVVVVSSCKRRKYLQLDEGPVRAYRHNGRAQHSFESIAPVLSLLSIFRVSPSIRFFKKSKNKSQRDIPQCVAPPPSPCSYPLLRLSRMLGQGGFTSCATSSSESPSRHIRINCYFGTALGPFWYTPFFLSPWQPAEAATSSLYCTRQNTVLHGLFFFLFFFCLNFYLNHRVLVAALCVESWRAVCCNHLK